MEAERSFCPPADISHSLFTASLHVGTVYEPRGRRCQDARTPGPLNQPQMCLQHKVLQIQPVRLHFVLLFFKKKTFFELGCYPAVNHAHTRVCFHGDVT